MRAALRGGFFTGGESYFQAQRFNEKEFIQKLLYNEVCNKSKQALMYELYTSLHGRALSSKKILRRTAREYVYRCRRNKCAHFVRVDASPAKRPSPLHNSPATYVTLRFTLFNDGFYPSFQPSFSFAFLPCAFLILLPKYGKRAPFRTRVRMTAICLILPKSYLRECWMCCRSISPIRPRSRRRLCSYSLRLRRTA